MRKHPLRLLLLDAAGPRARPPHLRRTSVLRSKTLGRPGSAWPTKIKSGAPQGRRPCGAEGAGELRRGDRLHGEGQRLIFEPAGAGAKAPAPFALSRSGPWAETALSHRKKPEEDGPFNAVARNGPRRTDPKTHSPAVGIVGPLSALDYRETCAEWPYIVQCAYSKNENWKSKH